jgi:hypothetical protein
VIPSKSFLNTTDVDLVTTVPRPRLLRTPQIILSATDL